jgi:hypothetical protein
LYYFLGSTIRIKLQSKAKESVPEPQTFKLEESVSVPRLARSRELAPVLQATKNREPVSVPQDLKVREQVQVLQFSKPRTASAPQKPRAEPVSQTFKPRVPVVPSPKLKEPILESLVPKQREVPQHTSKSVPKANGISGIPKPQGAWKPEAASSLVARPPSVSKVSLMKTKVEPCTRTLVPKEREAFQKPLPAVRPKQRDAALSPAVNQDTIQHSIQPVKPKVWEVKAEPVPASKSAPLVQQQVQVLNAKQRVDGDGPTHVLKQDRRAGVSGTQPVATDEPCFSGRILDAGEKKESKHHHHHRSKKSKRKEADKLFEELITNWKAPVVDQLQDEMPDLDWLMCGTKKRRVENEKGEDDWLSKSSSKCKAGEGLLDHAHDMLGSYQTRAVYIPELHTYQLPYVVPF